MWISTQISSYLIPGEIWESGYAAFPQLPPLSFSARDALEIERRSRKEVNLRNEARRYTLCCERMQGIVRELWLGRAPLQEPFVWRAYDSEQQKNPKAIAWLALSEFFRRFYTVTRNGKKDTLRYDRLEAIFHPPGNRISNLLLLFEKIQTEPYLAQIFDAVAQKAVVSNPVLRVTAEECRDAFESRYRLVQRCARESFGIVDVIDIV